MSLLTRKIYPWCQKLISRSQVSNAACNVLVPAIHSLVEIVSCTTTDIQFRVIGTNHGSNQYSSMRRMIYGPEFTRMMMSVSSIGHVLAFDRRGWSIMMRMRARGWLLWMGQCGRTLGMCHPCDMVSPCQQHCSIPSLLIEVRFVNLTGYVTSRSYLTEPT